MLKFSNCYLRHYTTVFKPTEVLMMMTAFASMETVHIAAYSHLLDTIGMPESEYSAFMKYKEMKDKYDYMQDFECKFKRRYCKNSCCIQCIYRRPSIICKFCNSYLTFQGIIK